MSGDVGGGRPGDGPAAGGRGPGSRVATGIASAAVLIATITVVARVVGFGRQVVFVRSVGVTCLNTAYTTANAIPNLVFEMVIGGALAAVVVPVLASAAHRGDRLQVRASASALLTWSVLVLAPITLLIVAFAGPLTALLLGDAGACADSYGQVADTSAQMLRIFAPQMIFYGLAVVLYGLLQAHRRFAAPALAPLVSSLVVIAAYLAYAVDAGESRGSIEALTTRQLALLAGGTTLGVMALALVPAVAAGRLRLRLRPALSFPDGVLPRVRALAAAAIGVVVAQQLATAVAIRLANDRGSEGAVGVYVLAWTVFLLPWSILAVPLATSAFPQLAARHDEGDREGWSALTAGVSRGVVLLSAVAAALLAATAEPVARVLALGAPGPAATQQVAGALVAFAPGLIGYGLLAHLTRACYAAHRGRAATAAVVVGWGVVVAVQLTLVWQASPEEVPAALGWGSTAGLTAAGVLLIWVSRRIGGPAATAGLARTSAGALLAAAAAGAAALAVVRLLGAGSTPWQALAVCAAAGAAGAAAGLGVAAVVDRRALATLRERRHRAAAG